MTTSVSSHPRECLAMLVALVLGLVLTTTVCAAEPEKPTGKPTTPNDEQTVKQALDHLKQFSDLVQRIRETEARQKCVNNLRQIGLQLQSADVGYLSSMSPATSYSQNWMYLLPYIEQDRMIYRSLYGRPILSGLGWLGINAELPGETLSSQANLPKGEGLVVSAVQLDSPADKAGLQAHDILLQFNGKPVPRNLAEMSRAIEGLKPKTTVDAVVLRKGKKVELKGLTVPEVSQTPGVYRLRDVPSARTFLSPSDHLDGTSNTIRVGERYTNEGAARVESPVPRYANESAAGIESPVLTTTFRKEDRFTTRYQEGSLVITLTGKLTQGKAAVAQVKVQDGGVEHHYPSLDKVPAEYQDKARDLVEVSEKGQDKIEIKK